MALPKAQLKLKNTLLFFVGLALFNYVSKQLGYGLPISRLVDVVCQIVICLILVYNIYLYSKNKKTE